MIPLQVPNAPASREEVVLDGVIYRLILTWNERAQGWTLGLEDGSGNGVIYGRRIVLNLDLLGGLHHLAIPAGAIFAVDPTSRLPFIGLDDLISGAVQLYYVPSEELINAA